MEDPVYTAHSTLEPQHIHELHQLYQGEWWSAGRTLEEVRRVLQHSDYLFTVRDEANRLVAFARVLTDKVFKAFVFDVIVAPDHREAGLGKHLLDSIVQHPDIQQVKHLELYCLPDMIPFYEKWGFSTDIAGMRLLRRTMSPTS